MSTIPELITAHRAAWQAFQDAPSDLAALRAENTMGDAFELLIEGECMSIADYHALQSHLIWYVLEEPHQCGSIATALLAALTWAHRAGEAG